MRAGGSGPTVVRSTQEGIDEHRDEETESLVDGDGNRLGAIAMLLPAVASADPPVTNPGHEQACAFFFDGKVYRGFGNETISDDGTFSLSCHLKLESGTPVQRPTTTGSVSATCWRRRAGRPALAASSSSDETRKGGSADSRAARRRGGYARRPCETI